MASTTIKVPVELRDRLAALAERDHTTLAGAIERSLDAADESAFWTRLAATMGSAAPGVSHRLAEDVSGSLADGLDPAESWDDVW